jgi:hypothetical protein
MASNGKAKAPNRGCRTASGERYPDVSVEILLVGRPRRGIVMNAGSFHVGPVSLGRGIVDDHKQSIGQRQDSQHQEQQLGRDGFGLASKCGQEVIIVLVVVGDAGRPQPGRHGSASVGEKDAHQQDRQSPAVSRVQPRRQPLAPLLPIVRTLPTAFRFGHPWLSYHLRLGKRLVMEEPFSLQERFCKP